MAVDFDNARHPDWRRMIRRWQMANDFWRGGIHILDPDHPATDALVAEESRTDGGEDPEPDTINSAYQWRTVESKSYLWKHAREATHEYDDRARRIVNLPVFQYVCNTLAAGVLRNSPTRTGMSALWKGFHDDMDLAGTDVDAFMRRALSLALVHGRVHCVVDKRRFEETAVSRKEQVARGERAYAYLVLPQDLVDWAVDDDGRFRWAVVAEAEPDDREPGEAVVHGSILSAVGGEITRTQKQYRVWTRERWILYRKSDDGTGQEKWTEYDTDEHGLGEVPVYTLFCTRYPDPKCMACESPVADVLDLNRDVINKLSELDEIERSQTFGVMAIPTMEGLSTGGFDIGPYRAITYPAQAGTPSYLDPNPSHPTGKWQRIGEKLFVGRQLAGVSRGKAEYSKEERSASAIAAEAEDKKNQLAWWAKSLQEFDGRIHAAMAAHEEVSAPTVAYSTNFDIKGTMVEVQEVLQLSSVPLMGESHKALSAILSPVVRRLLTEQGVTDSDVDAAIADIEATAEDMANKGPESDNAGLPVADPPPPVPGVTPDDNA